MIKTQCPPAAGRGRLRPGFPARTGRGLVARAPEVTQHSGRGRAGTGTRARPLRRRVSGHVTGPASSRVATEAGSEEGPRPLLSAWVPGRRLHKHRQEAAGAWTHVGPVTRSRVASAGCPLHGPPRPSQALASRWAARGRPERGTETGLCLGRAASPGLAPWPVAFLPEPWALAWKRACGHSGRREPCTHRACLFQVQETPRTGSASNAESWPRSPGVAFVSPTPARPHVASRCPCVAPGPSRFHCGLLRGEQWGDDTAGHRPPAPAPPALCAEELAPQTATEAHGPRHCGGPSRE
nr:uncharacterized protein LOC105856545 isoform X3 [Microcebus murinus]